MAITKQDLHDLAQELKTAWRSDLIVAFKQHGEDLKRDIRDEMDARFTASENRIKKDMRAEFLDVLQQNILPAIERTYTEIDRVRAYVGMK
jgi:hypothetical protein